MVKNTETTTPSILEQLQAGSEAAKLNNEIISNQNMEIEKAKNLLRKSTAVEPTEEQAVAKASENRPDLFSNIVNSLSSGLSLSRDAQPSNFANFLTLLSATNAPQALPAIQGMVKQSVDAESGQKELAVAIQKQKVSTLSDALKQAIRAGDKEAANKLMSQLSTLTGTDLPELTSVSGDGERKTYKYFNKKGNPVFVDVLGSRVLSRSDNGNIGDLNDLSGTGITPEIISERIIAGEEAKLPYKISDKVMMNVVKPEFGQAVSAVNSTNRALELMKENPDIFRNVVARNLRMGNAGEFEQEVKQAILLTVFAQSGKQVTDKERKAFDKIYNPKWFQDEDLARKMIEKMGKLAELKVNLFLHPEQANDIVGEIIGIQNDLGVKEGDIDSLKNLGKQEGNSKTTIVAKSEEQAAQIRKSPNYDASKYTIEIRR